MFEKLLQMREKEESKGDYRHLDRLGCGHIDGVAGLVGRNLH